MNSYEGLNLSQLIDLMHGLVEPESVLWTPQTIGWFVIALWLVSVGFLIARKVVRTWLRNRYRRAALAELKIIESYTRKGQPTGASVATLLKRTALAAYPREEVANLYGAEWAEFLSSSCRGDRVVVNSVDALSTAAYRLDVDVEALIKPARRWIEKHRA